MNKSLAVIMDPLAQVNVAKDTTLVLLQAAAAKGWQLYYLQQSDLLLRDGKLYAWASSLALNSKSENWYQLGEQTLLPITTFKVILMRKDPPVDLNYIYATQLLELAEKSGVKVVNNPRSLRDMNEKLFISWFPQCCAPSLVTSRISNVKEFLAEQQDIILKPLHDMGGNGIFRLRAADPNTTMILQTMTQHGQTPIMAQRYIAEIAQGDKRILMINGEAVPYGLARIPAKGEVRANLVAGGVGKVVKLSKRDHWIAQQVGDTLKAKGLMFVGLDVIGDYLTEINVTSPTCLKQIADETGLDLGAQVMESIESVLPRF